MIKKLTCIECPKGCRLEIDVENNNALKVSANGCPRGEKYALSEIENPVRTLTSTVVGEGLDFKMIPVKTDRPIPKSRIFEAMNEVRKIRVKRPLDAGGIIVRNFLGLGLNLVSTRKVERHG